MFIKIDTSNTQIHDRSLSCLRIDTYAYIVTHRLLLWAQIGDIKTPRMLGYISELLLVFLYILIITSLDNLL
jgi:hypothetical protein